MKFSVDKPSGRSIGRQVYAGCVHILVVLTRGTLTSNSPTNCRPEKDQGFILQMLKVQKGLRQIVLVVSAHTFRATRTIIFVGDIPQGNRIESMENN